MKRIKSFSANPNSAALKAVLVGIAVGTAACALLLLVSAAVIKSSGKLPQNTFQPLILIISSASAFLAGFFSAKVIKKRGLIFGAVCGAVLFLICLAGGAANTQDTFGASALTRMLAMIFAGALGGYLGVYKRQNIR